jgi:hypothetical protein
VTEDPTLIWKPMDGYPSYEIADLGDFTAGDGVRFHVELLPTCYRRGPFKLLIEVAGLNHTQWGCFDDQDQPLRYYHLKENLRSEAREIAKVLLADRLKHGHQPPPHVVIAREEGLAGLHVDPPRTTPPMESPDADL